MIDCSDDNYATAYDTLCDELSSYSPALMEKPRIVLCNKTDVDGAFDRALEIIEKIRSAAPEIPVIPVSAMTGRGLDNARREIINLVNRLENRALSEPGKAPESPESSFMNSRAFVDDEPVQYPGSEQ